MISHKYKAIFIHVPKTGGKSIANALSKCQFKSISLQSPTNDDDATGAYRMGTARRGKRSVSDEIWNTYYKFAFVRNPYDRCISNYFYLKYHKTMSFADFIKKDLLRVNDIWHHELTQTTHLYDNGNYPDFIGRFEDLQCDFDHVCDAIGIPHMTLPHLNSSNRNTIYIDDHMQLSIYEKYKEDFDNFNYDRFYDDTSSN